LHREKTLLGFSRVVRPALAGLLILGLLVSGALSVSQALHQLLHSDASADSHICLACSIAQGHVSVAGAAAMPVAPVASWFSAPLTPEVLPSAGCDYRLSPSRAPPALLSISPAIA
jgi:hypothetical protein